MKTDEALKFLINKALQYGYTEQMIAPFVFELRERLSMMETTDEDDLIKLFDEIF